MGDCEMTQHGMTDCDTRGDAIDVLTSHVTRDYAIHSVVGKAEYVGDAHEQDIPHEINHEVMRHPLYESLAIVLRTAYCHAAYEKGHERHAEDDVPFEEQISARINKEHRGFALGQALKKIHEAGRLPKERAVKELLGAINFIAIEVIQLKVSDDNHSDAGSV